MRLSGMPFSDDFDDPDSGASPFDEPDELGETPQIVEGQSTRTMPHPLTGRMTKFPRASSWGGVISDKYTVDEWRKALVTMGLGAREDLWALASSDPTRRLYRDVPVEDRPTGWWRPYAEIADKALAAAESMSGAHKGTSIHAWGEQLDRGQIELSDVPERFREHMLHYQRVRLEAGLHVHGAYIEKLVLTLNLHNGVCGRLDGLRVGPGGWLITDDTKTGRQAPKGLDEIAVQLAVYANAEWHWDGGETANFGWVPAPSIIRKDVATVTWVPINQPKLSEVIPVDIEWGWQAAKVVAWIKGYRNMAVRKNNSLRLPMSALHDIRCMDCGALGGQVHAEWHAPGCAFA
jgi:hypothetical protein